jgi:fructokinase
MPAVVFAGVEMGGTKCVCSLGTGPNDVRAQQVLPTRDPEVTLAAIAAVLETWDTSVGGLAAIGIASFGPLELRHGSDRFGRMGATPKPQWRGTDLAGFFGRRFRIPIHLTTDVIGAALAEGRWGAAQGLSDYAYVTVGTGVGVGLIVDGRPVIGCHHPELGHMRIVRFPGDRWPGICPFHGDCVEGLISGPALEARHGAPAATVPVDSEIWNIVAHALAQLSHNLVLSVAPQRILIGGGVASAHLHLFARVHRYLAQSLNGYLDIEELTSGIDRYVGPPGLGVHAGPLGSIALAASHHSS